MKAIEIFRNEINQRTAESSGMMLNFQLPDQASG